MPNLYSPDSRDYSKYDAMTTQELERILDRYFLLPEDFKDKDLMVHIMEVLTERDIEVIDANISNPNASWDDFLKAHPNIARTDQNSSEQGKILEVSAWKRASSRRLLRRITGIAAIFVCILLGGTITAYAAGIDFFQVVAHWTDDIFCFSLATSESEEKQIPDQLHPLYEKLKSFDTMPLIPTYLPLGYEFDSVDSFVDSESSAVFCKLAREKEPIIIDYIFHNTPTKFFEYEKDSGEPETVEVGKTTIYLLSNSGSYTATWIEGNIESCISMGSKEELIKIIESLR